MVLDIKKSYSKKTKELKDIMEELEEAEEELSECAGRLDEIENDICVLKRKRDQLMKDCCPQDLSAALPTPLKQRGYKLTEIVAKLPHPQMQITLFSYTEPAGIFRYTVLEDNAGEMVKRWECPVSIAELLEMR